MNRKIVALSGCVLSVLLVAAGCQSGRGASAFDAWAMDYHLQEHKDPRPNRVHILRVDLSAGKSEPAVVIGRDPDGDGPAETALTNPLKLAADEDVLAFINTNPWDSFPDASGKKNRSWYEGQPVDIEGLAASGGSVRSPIGRGHATVWVNKAGSVFVGPPPAGSLREGMSGFHRIVKQGAVTGGPGGPRHPRTAIGVDRTGRVLWLVVVDGRQKGFSEGMTTHDLGVVMRDLGCWDAVNMDGGGSSIMAFAGPDGRLRVANSPSDRRGGKVRIRPLPMILTIRKKPAR